MLTLHARTIVPLRSARTWTRFHHPQKIGAPKNVDGWKTLRHHIEAKDVEKIGS